MEVIQGTWHWAISGFFIGLIMLVLTYFGKTFGMSSNLRTICSMSFPKKKIEYFNFFAENSSALLYQECGH